MGAELKLPPLSDPVTLAKVEALVFRVPIDEPVITSFGVMHCRPGIVVRLEDDQGVVGWGEVWCNFPAVGAEHRARLLTSVVAPLLLERPWKTPADAFETLTRKLHILAIQSGEEGPVAQVTAGVDIALWDLVAHRLGKPLWQLLGGRPKVSVYASGINPVEPEKLAARKRAEGYRAFKLKVGFGIQRDVANLQALRDVLGPDAPLMVDANQAWDVETTLASARQMAAFNIRWLEEPMPADAPAGDWARIATASPIPLAGGENIRGNDEFARAIDQKILQVIQPDVGKWGGFSGCLTVGRQARERGKLFCPHWLGGGIGQIASLHLKAAIGGDGYVEVDSNDNPLRELLGRPFPAVDDGRVDLSLEPGLGVDPDVGALQRYRVLV